MKRIILAAALSLMFTAPANAIGPNDVLLTCWTDGADIKSMKETATIILKPGTETVDLINPYNILQNGSLTVTEYFYIIKISSKSNSKIGKIKINRFTGRFSSHWQEPDEKQTTMDDSYGICTKKPFGGAL
ncbi:hypothetical protein LCGC14_2744160 [marine sediment metagenome]|uniref:Uncharacterized protein n=1 Tax=marine sediment metagenome TaxID=412755 RepID=A0A0F9BCH3_9ZZZZ